MGISRRAFLAAGIGVAAAATSGCSLSNPGISSKLEGEDGSELWLRYRSAREGLPAIGACEVNAIGTGPAAAATVDAIRAELALFHGRRDADGVPILVGRKDLLPATELAGLGREGFLIRTMVVRGRSTIVVAGQTDVGTLYGTFHLIRLIQTGMPVTALNIAQVPRLQLRLVNHWDNLNGSIERGYAGDSLWNWSELPGKLSRRLTDYARANASIGINGTVLNNVNASATFLTADYLRKAAALADLWRPYGIRVYLSANFSAPVTLDKLPTADPLHPLVVEWWRKKAEEIYRLIPDFGGLLVKANSEGQPGPQDFGRTHAEGANMMADALAPHGGNVIWRAFIYDESVDPDRAKRAYIEFMGLEGQFKSNVLIQVKNGPIDFMPREPFHPLFGAMVKTPVMAEIQATQEYLGQAKHLVYLGTMWKEFLDADTFAKGPGSTVGQVLEGKVHPQGITGMATVLNTGSDANWCGHHFSQANWYAAGRLAWDHALSAQAIAREWVQQTFTRAPAAVETITRLMMGSHETFVDYTMPLGLHHLIGDDPATGDRHYAPKPWNDTAQRRDWTATYYHQASQAGIGFDRTRKGDKAVEQYFPAVRDIFDDAEKCPDRLLLWFHRLPWDHKMKSGQTLWGELCVYYYRGAAAAAKMDTIWASLAGVIDERRHREVAERLAIQAADATAWRDKILAYFASFSGKPVL